MDKKAIEDLAVAAVKESVTVCDLLSPFISDNDKEPSWDGHIYIYKNRNKTKDGMRRIPVQVKGTEKDNLSKAEISFRVSKIDLNNYLEDGGIVFFVVYIGHNGQAKQIYYAGLTPVKIRILLDEAKEQASKSIKLHRFPKDNNKKEMIIINCCEDCQRQASFAKAKLLSIEELEQQGALESLTFSVTSVGGLDPQTALLTNDVYLYANIKGGTIPQPIEAVPQRLVIHEERNARISVEQRLLYTKFTFIRDANAITMQFGKSFSITSKEKGHGIKFNYKGTNSLRQLVIDLDFMLALIRENGFSIDDTFVPLDMKKADYSNFPIAEMEDRLAYFKKIVQLFDLLNCPKDIILDTLNAKDWRTINNLVCGLVDGRSVEGLKEDLSPIIMMEVGELHFIVCLLKDESQKGTYRFADFFHTEMLFVYENQTGEKLATSQFSLLRAENILKADNIRYDALLPSFQKVERHKETMTRANFFLLELLTAYDINQKSEILDTASAFSEWIMTASEEELPYSIRILNDLQIKKRQRQLTEEEKRELYRLIEMPDSTEETIVGAYLLLDQQTASELHFEKVQADIQNEFKKYPIYHFWNDEGQTNGQA